MCVIKFWELIKIWWANEVVLPHTYQISMILVMKKGLIETKRTQPGWGEGLDKLGSPEWNPPCSVGWEPAHQGWTCAHQGPEPALRRADIRLPNGFSVTSGWNRFSSLSSWVGNCRWGHTHLTEQFPTNEERDENRFHPDVMENPS